MALCTFCGIGVQEIKSNEIADIWVGISKLDKDKEAQTQKRRWSCYRCLEIIDAGMKEIHDLCDKLQEKTRTKLLKRQLTNAALEVTNPVDGPLRGGKYKQKFISFFLDFAKRGSK